MKQLILSAIILFLSCTGIFAQTGNSGIGTTTPASKLTVNGNAAVGSGYAGTAAPANGAIIQGNVGIGTAAPTVKLQVEGSQYLNAAVTGVAVKDVISINIGQDGFQYGNRTDNFGILMRTNTSASTGSIARINFGDISTGTVLGKRYLSFSVGNPLKEMMYLTDDNSGRVGIGTAVPTSMLSVNGEADKVGSTAWATFSDMRMKKNVIPYTKGLNEILKINAVTFQYNGKGGYKEDGKTYVGVLAQEIENVLPGTVTKIKTADFADQRRYDPSEITYTLINAIQEQQQEIEQLKKANSGLTAEINKVSQLNDELSSLRASIKKLSDTQAQRVVAVSHSF